MPVELAEATLSDGRTFLFEQDDPDSAGSYNVSTTTTLDRLDFEAALETIKAAASRMGESLRNLPSAPSAYEITFGIKLSADLGVILAKAGAEANFTVRLSWANRSG